VKQLVARKHITVESRPETNSTKAITNGFQQDKKRSHRPTRSTRLKQSNKAHSLTLYSHVCNCCLQCNTHSQCETSLSCNCRAKRYQSKRVTTLLKEKQNTKPNNSSFSLNVRKSPPSSRLTVCRNRNIISYCRTSTLLTPFQMNTFQSLSVPKTTNRFAKTRLGGITCVSPRVVQRMIYSQNQHSNCHCHCPNV
jgi:hypothetical protein